MVKIVRGAVVADVLCAAQRHGLDVYVYLPLDQISAEAAAALGAVLTDVIASAIPPQRVG